MYNELQPRAVLRAPGVICAGAAVASLAACNGSDDPGNTLQVAAQATGLVCDDTMKTAFRPDADTTVLLVRHFKKGEALALSTSASVTAATAASDVCLVKLNVGPGNAGPAGAPSTTPGIGIEIWLPEPAARNNRIHAKGGNGWAGGVHGS